ncbi:hypothetical protein AB5I41_28945 [Sphingomonas sp. MMS24-JH45]
MQKPLAADFIAYADGAGRNLRSVAGAGIAAGLAAARGASGSASTDNAARRTRAIRPSACQCLGVLMQAIVEAMFVS